MIERKADPTGCEEAAIGIPFYAPCNEPAEFIVGWKGRSDQPIRMCKTCADHNVRNRGGEVLRKFSAEEVTSTAQTERYLVWSNEHSAWWGPGGRGYVKGAGSAGRYTRAQALQVCTQAVAGSHRGMFNELPVREADLREFIDGTAMLPADLL